MNLENCPADIGFFTLDQIAECFEGISSELYRKLWELTSLAAQAGKAQPLGGDGSNGTTEIPIIGGEYANVLKHAWPNFTDAEKEEIIKATQESFDEAGF